MTNAEARFNKSLRPRKPEGSLGRTAQDLHLDSHTALELCMEVGGEVGYIPIATLSSPDALRWEAMRALLMFHNCERQSLKTVSTATISEEKGEPKRIRTEVPLLTSVPPRAVLIYSQPRRARINR